MSGAIDARVASIKDRLLFGEVAAEQGLSGSSRSGWDCPGCCGERTLKERRDEQGGRCQACDTGFDVIDLVKAARGESFTGALRLLEELADKKAAAGGTIRAPGLFDDGGPDGQG